MLLKNKKIYCLLFALIFSLMMGCNKDTSTMAGKKDGSWSVISSLETSGNNNITGFLNENYGISAGYSGEINFTKDSGKIWEKGINSSYCLFGLYILNDKVAWTSGNASCVRKTEDGAGSWQNVLNFGGSEPNHCKYISFIDENNGWIASSTPFSVNEKSFMLGTTKNGGNLWTEVNLPKDIEEIVAIHLSSINEGYILDRACNLYMTTNGGKSFSKKTLKLEEAAIINELGPNVVLRVSNKKNIFIAYKGENNKLKAMRSYNGGKTWSKEKLPDINSGTLYLSPDGKFLTVTNNGVVSVLKYN